MTPKPLSKAIFLLIVGVVVTKLFNRKFSVNGLKGFDAFAQWRISKAMTNVHQNAKKEGSIGLDSANKNKYVIFSDHHKGAGTKADDFRENKDTYLAALTDYFDKGYTLIVLGDAEELWEEDPADVIQAYPDVFALERRFHDENRYIRIYGNHDNVWRFSPIVGEILAPMFPGITVKEGIVFDFSDSNGTKGELFLAHGHQGTIDSDYITPFSRWIVRNFWKRIQILTDAGRTSPSQDACLRAKHDSQMYRWAAGHEKLVLIAGHTHRPIWSSRSHLDKLINELLQLQKIVTDPLDPQYRAEIERISAEIKRRMEKYPPCTDTVKTRPSYFNTGCCSFKDGDITGMELTSETISLVKWRNDKENGTVERKELEQTTLSELFLLLEHI